MIRRRGEAPSCSASWSQLSATPSFLLCDAATLWRIKVQYHVCFFFVFRLLLPPMQLKIEFGLLSHGAAEPFTPQFKTCLSHVVTITPPQLQNVTLAARFSRRHGNRGHVANETSTSISSQACLRVCVFIFIYLFILLSHCSRWSCAFHVLPPIGSKGQPLGQSEERSQSYYPPGCRRWAVGFCFSLSPF